MPRPALLALLCVCVVRATAGAGSVCPGVREWATLRRLAGAGAGSALPAAALLLSSPSLAALAAPARAQAVDALARAYSVLGRPADAAAVRAAALAGAGSAAVSGADSAPYFARLRLVAALTQELRASGDLSGADAALAAARRALAAAPADTAALLSASLLHMEAAVADCRGDAAGALRRLDRAAIAAPPAPGSVERVHVLHKAAAAARGGNASRLRARFAAEAAALVARGPWRRPDQLPAAFDAALPATPPWHAADAGRGGGDARMTTWLWMQPLVPLLRGAAAALAREFAALDAAGALQPERDCIHVGAGGGGGWRVLTVTGAGPPPEALDAACCNAAAAPAACALLAAVAAADLPGAPAGGLRVLRGGYSAVAAGTHLRPHFGTTNAHIKLHVGLVVPPAAGAPAAGAAAVAEDGSVAAAAGAGGGGGGGGGGCVWLRVGAERVSWHSRGQVLVFDDSFEHELRNDCAGERVVFQVVVAHPDAPREAEGGARSQKSAA
jgi:tetratricopeptide (TPR) repeat protein